MRLLIISYVCGRVSFRALVRADLSRAEFISKRTNLSKNVYQLPHKSLTNSRIRENLESLLMYLHRDIATSCFYIAKAGGWNFLMNLQQGASVQTCKRTLQKRSKVKPLSIPVMLQFEILSFILFFHNINCN